MSTLFTTTYEGHYGTNTVTCTDTDDVESGGDAEIVGVPAWTIGEPRTSFDGKGARNRGGKIGSEITIELLGDEDRTIRDALDSLADERRYQLHLTGPRGDGTTFNSYWLVQGTEVVDTMNPPLYPLGNFAIVCIDGIGLLDRDAVFGDTADPLIQQMDETYWQLREAQGTLHGFDDVRAGGTIELDDALNMDELRIALDAEAGETIEERVDILLQNFHCFLFQPSNAQEWWVLPNVLLEKGNDANLIDITDDDGASTTASTFTEYGIIVDNVEWGADDTWGRVLAVGDITMKGAGLGQLVNRPLLVEAFDYVTGSMGSASPDGNWEIPATGVYRKFLIRLPELENVAVRVDVSQVILAIGGQTAGGAGFYVEGGDTTGRIPGAGTWASGDPDIYQTLLGTPSQESATGTTGLMELSDWEGGDLYVYIYGQTNGFGDAEFKEVKAWLVDAETQQIVTSLVVKGNVTAQRTDKVEIPLITRWEALDGTWADAEGWNSLITGDDHFAFASAVTAERIAIHTRSRWFSVELDGIYTPEYGVVIRGGTDTPFPATEFVNEDVSALTSVTSEDSGSSDGAWTIECTFNAGDSQAFLYLRSLSAVSQLGYRIRFRSNGEIMLQNSTAGGTSSGTIFTAVGANAGTYTLFIRMKGDRIQIFRDGILLGSDIDSALAAHTFWGMTSNDTTIQNAILEGPDAAILARIVHAEPDIKTGLTRATCLEVIC